MDEPDLVESARRALVELLSLSSHPGARLKRLLQRRLQQQGCDFDERRLGYPKFIAFLRDQSDLLEIANEGRPGDVVVSLRSNQPLDFRPSPRADEPLQKAVWQAFTNPDPARRRYLHIGSGRIVHYLVSMASPQDREMEARVRQDAANYIEIKSISPDDQKSWMAGFLDRAPLEPDQLSALKRLLEAPYSGHMNGVFIDALGRLAPSYRTHRAMEVSRHVERWAREQDVPMALLTEARTEDDAHSGAGAVCAGKSSTSRQRVEQLVHAVMSELSEDELRCILVPAAILLAGRR